MTDKHFDPRRPDQEVTLHVSGLHCTNCALSIEKHLARVGATNASVDFATGRTRFTLANSHKLSDIVESIKGLGYSVTDGPDEHSHERDTAILIKTVISAILTAPMLLGMFFPIHWIHEPTVQAILATPIFIIGITHFGISGIRSLRSGVANMDVLIAAGILAAYSASIVTMLYGFSHDLLFFEAVGSIVTFVLIGHLLEELAVKKTTSAIEDLSRLQPQEARRIVIHGDGRETVETVQVIELRAGDLLQVNSGDRAPTDGIVASGVGSFDESMLTGESLPVDRREGSAVFGGTVLLDGSIVLRATAIGESTTLAGIIKLVRDAQQRKPSIQRIGDAISAVFVPAVLGIAVVWLVVSLVFFDLSLAQAIVRSLAIVVIACPCAMGLATPTAIMVALGRAAKAGILIRGGDTLERLGQIRHVAFDKTGTLTRGEIAVTELRLVPGSDPDRIKALLASLQRGSSHPIAQAVYKHFQGSTKQTIPLNSFIEKKGFGVEARDSNGTLYQCGGRALASTLGAEMEGDVILSENGKIIATILLTDQLRAEAQDVVTQLHTLGCSTSIISGDTKEKCEEVARLVGIASVHAQQVPSQKVEVLRAVQESRAAAYVGDGVNDAPTLAEAGVGISVSSGSDIAIQSAQVLLTGNSIASLPAAIRLARLTVGTIKQNLLWALVYNLAAVPLAASGYISPLAGALLMTCSDLVIVGNSLRIKYRRIS